MSESLDQRPALHEQRARQAPGAPVSVSRWPIGATWKKLSALPFGKHIFSWMVGRSARYTGSVGGIVQELGNGHCVVLLKDRAKVRNHLGSIHAIALINVGEMVTGLSMIEQIDGHGRGILKNISMSYLKKARGTLTAEASCEAPTRPGTHEIDVKGSLRDSAGEVVAEVIAHWKIDIYG